MLSQGLHSLILEQLLLLLLLLLFEGRAIGATAAAPWGCAGEDLPLMLILMETFWNASVFSETPGMRTLFTSIVGTPSHVEDSITSEP